MTYTKESLIAFERRVEQAFLDKRIHAPVHLSGGNEDQLIAIFKDVRPGDWVFSTWRSHYHALLKGIPEEWVWNEVLAGRSMYLMNREHRFLSSAIVGGTLPIACGVAMGVKRKAEAPISGWSSGAEKLAIKMAMRDTKVWVFVGDMTARTGLFHEFVEYCGGHSLPVKIVVEDNGLSTNTPTYEVWGRASYRHLGVEKAPPDDWPYPEIFHSWYHYERTYPHVGVGKHVVF